MVLPLEEGSLGPGNIRNKSEAFFLKVKGPSNIIGHQARFFFSFLDLRYIKQEGSSSTPKRVRCSRNPTTSLFSRF